MICWILKLPEEIQNALREGAIGVLLGYIFAASLDHSYRMEIFSPVRNLKCGCQVSVHCHEKDIPRAGISTFATGRPSGHSGPGSTF
jgi:hypothetical protein